VDHALDRIAARAQIALLGFRVVADRDGADRLVVVRHSERVPERLDLLGHDPEIQRPKALVDRSEQLQHCRHSSVDVPERNRPPRLVAVRPTLVRLRVTVKVCALA
jgi:hypothetical protein